MAPLPVVSNLSLNTLRDGALVTSRNSPSSQDFWKRCVELLPHFEAESVLPTMRWGSPQQRKSSASAPATLLESERGSGGSTARCPGHGLKEQRCGPHLGGDVARGSGHQEEAGGLVEKTEVRCLKPFLLQVCGTLNMWQKIRNTETDQLHVGKRLNAASRARDWGSDGSHTRSSS